MQLEADRGSLRRRGPVLVLRLNLQPELVRDGGAGVRQGPLRRNAVAARLGTAQRRRVVQCDPCLGQGLADQAEQPVCRRGQQLAVRLEEAVAGAGLLSDETADAVALISKYPVHRGEEIAAGSAALGVDVGDRLAGNADGDVAREAEDAVVSLDQNSVRRLQKTEHLARCLATDTDRRLTFQLEQPFIRPEQHRVRRDLDAGDAAGRLAACALGAAGLVDEQAFVRAQDGASRDAESGRHVTRQLARHWDDAVAGKLEELVVRDDQKRFGHREQVSVRELRRGGHSADGVARADREPSSVFARRQIRSVQPAEVVERSVRGARQPHDACAVVQEHAVVGGEQRPVWCVLEAVDHSSRLSGHSAYLCAIRVVQVLGRLAAADPGSSLSPKGWTTTSRGAPPKCVLKPGRRTDRARYRRRSADQRPCSGTHHKRRTDRCLEPARSCGRCSGRCLLQRRLAAPPAPRGPRPPCRSARRPPGAGTRLRPPGPRRPPAPIMRVRRLPPTRDLAPVLAPLLKTVRLTLATRGPVARARHARPTRPAKLPTTLLLLVGIALWRIAVRESRDLTQIAYRNDIVSPVYADLLAAATKEVHWCTGPSARHSAIAASRLVVASSGCHTSGKVDRRMQTPSAAASIRWPWHRRSRAPAGGSRSPPAREHDGHRVAGRFQHELAVTS